MMQWISLACLFVVSARVNPEFCFKEYNNAGQGDFQQKVLLPLFYLTAWNTLLLSYKSGIFFAMVKGNKQDSAFTEKRGGDIIVTIMIITGLVAQMVFASIVLNKVSEGNSAFQYNDETEQLQNDYCEVYLRMYATSILVCTVLSLAIEIVVLVCMFVLPKSEQGFQYSFDLNSDCGCSVKKPGFHMDGPDYAEPLGYDYQFASDADGKDGGYDYQFASDADGGGDGGYDYQFASDADGGGDGGYDYQFAADADGGNDVHDGLGGDGATAAQQYYYYD